MTKPDLIRLMIRFDCFYKAIKLLTLSENNRIQMLHQDHKQIKKSLNRQP